MSNAKGTGTDTTVEWYTPREITDLLGRFDLDPAAPSTTHWTANKCLTQAEDGLETPWDDGAYVWLNPPYGRGIEAWARKMAIHGNGIMLVFMRSETRWMQEDALTADLMLLPDKRIKFVRGDGSGGEAAPPAPPVFFAYGHYAAARLSHAWLSGKISGRIFRELNPDDAIHLYHPDDAELRAKWEGSEMSDDELRQAAERWKGDPREAGLRAMLEKRRGKRGGPSSA